MFLFTSLPAPADARTASQAAGSAPAPVVDAIRDGSAKSGADFEYLLKTARRESSLDPSAKAKSSSASGLFQFIEQTWLGMVKGKGGEHGLGEYAQAINAQNGRYDVADPSLKAEILQLRNDPSTAAVMAGEFTRRNSQTLAGALGRQPTDGELYAAHFMGAGGAADLIREASSRPDANAAALFPDQAGSNRAIFYDKASGKPRTVAEVYKALVSDSAGAAVPNVPRLSSDPSTWLSGTPSTTVPAYAHADGPAMHGLFRTEGQRGPMNQTVQKLWSGMPARAVDEDAKRFFPRSASASTDAGASNSGTPQTFRGLPANVPLPPERPVEFGASVRTASTQVAALAPSFTRPGLAQLGLSPQGRVASLPASSQARAAPQVASANAGPADPKTRTPRAPLDLNAYFKPASRTD
jgi:hypothetical protein